MSITVENLSYIYGKKTPFEKKALDNLSFTIRDGESVGLIGSTGSGKSTLLQHFNALIRLQTGKMVVFDIDLGGRKPDLNGLRRNVGMLFQYPEYQLFAETVQEDVMFGPKNFGMSKEECERCSREAVEMVGLSWEEIKDRSPLELSGGQKRRVAMAGVLAYQPKMLVLDEPTAGLDPVGKVEMLDTIASLRRKKGLTVITVSHNMDEIAEYCERVIVLGEGKILCDTTPEDLFYNKDIEKMRLHFPHAVHIVKLLEEKGIFLPHVLTEKRLEEELLLFLQRGRANA